MSAFRLVDGRTFDPSTGGLSRGGSTVWLEPQPAAVLALLIERAGIVVTYDEIRRAVWGEQTHVSVHESVHYCIRHIRAAIGDTPRSPQFIETFHRRGYRFRPEALVTCDPALLEADCRAVVERPRTAMSRWSIKMRLTAACAAAAVLTFILVAERRPNNHHQTAVAILKRVHDLVY